MDIVRKTIWLYLFKTQSETSNVFKKFKAMAEVQFNSKIKSLQTDWGGEFRPLKSFLANCGIQHRPICPTPIIKMGLWKENTDV